MSKKYYVVKKGLIPGIYDNWLDTKKQINCFAQQSYKSFTTLVAATDYWNNCQEINDNSKETNDNSEAIAYVDGSFKKSTKEFSYGLVFLYQGQTIKLFQKFNDQKWAQLQNVAGEIMGAQKAMQLAVKYHLKSLLIYYDYQGISKWCTGEWKTNKDETKAYKAFYHQISQKVTIKFQWVKSHSGNKFNEMADRLAAQAFNLKEHTPIIKFE